MIHTFSYNNEIDQEKSKFLRASKVSFEIFWEAADWCFHGLFSFGKFAEKINIYIGSFNKSQNVALLNLALNDISVYLDTSVNVHKINIRNIHMRKTNKK